MDSTQNDDFAEYKRQYEFHADAWLVARAHGEQGLSRRSAQQMLRALRGMYRFYRFTNAEDSARGDGPWAAINGYRLKL